MSSYGTTLDLLFLVGVAGILFLCWVLLHLHIESRQSGKGRQRRGPTHLQSAGFNLTGKQAVRCDRSARQGQG